MGFEVLGPLPRGTTVLEASAGTGKTWTIASLSTRYVAEGVVELSELMLVTFGRAATQELRERTRERLATVAEALADPGSSADPLVQHLAGVGADDCRRRLLRALSDFDAATIATTHSFCQRMLDGLGTAGEREPGAVLVEGVDDLVVEVVDDLYLRDYAGHDATVPELTVALAQGVAREAVRDRQARLVPADAGPGTAAGQRVAIATAARREVERRKRQRGVRDFDDLLVLLRDVLADPVRGPAACARIRGRYRVVLVDEFQDTDPVQWEVLRRAFHGATTLVLIGDPKQAIYAFRGAEVLSYLDAVRLADTHETLPTNHRSDPGLLLALEHLYGGAALGHPDIVVHPVGAARAGTRLPGQPPFRLRVLAREPPLGSSGHPAIDALRRSVAGDLASEVVALLDSGTELEGRPVAPGDLAVLVRNHTHVTAVRAALEAAGVPSVQAGSASVFATPGAADWLRLLQAVEQPHRSGRVRLAALTSLLGWTAERLAGADDEEVARVGAQLREWSALFEDAGLAAVFERLATEQRLESRLLGTQGGERRLTDLRHVAQALQRAAVDGGLGLTALTGWLAERVADPGRAAGSDRSRRLESDAAAVQVVTVHASKGLEFPVVYLPYAWDGAKNPSLTTLLLHDDDGARIRDLGGKGGPGYADRLARHGAEEAGEELRLLYVALTRAQCQVVAWWAPGAQTSAAPLQRLLMGRTADAAPAARAAVPADGVALDRLRQWAGRAADGLIDVQPVGAPAPVRWRSPHTDPVELAVARFDRHLDEDWRRTSYSALTAGAHESPAGGADSEAEEPDRQDESDTDTDPQTGTQTDTDPGTASAVGLPSTMNDLPAGAAFGTVVHEVLEIVDTAATDLAAELRRRCHEVVGRRLAPVDADALAGALLPVLHTPLGHGTLAGVAPADRLTELDFELPLAGGDDPRAVVTLGHVADLLRAYLAPDDVLAAYADLAAGLDAPPLRGYLSGSIDAVLRTPGGGYVVVDYKTNRLARGELSTLHYTREAMATEMLRSHYVLQALLYGVALLRYLRWRQPGVEPLISVQYLFLRGMAGPATPPGCGVFDWRPPPGLLPALSDLLAGDLPTGAP